MIVLTVLAFTMISASFAEKAVAIETATQDETADTATTQAPKTANFGVGVSFKPYYPQKGIHDYIPINGAKVTLTNNETHEVFTYITDGSEYGVHQDIPRGVYTMHLESVPAEYQGRFDMPKDKVIHADFVGFDGFNVEEFAIYNFKAGKNGSISKPSSIKTTKPYLTYLPIPKPNDGYKFSHWNMDYGRGSMNLSSDQILGKNGQKLALFPYGVDFTAIFEKNELPLALTTVGSDGKRGVSVDYVLTDSNGETVEGLLDKNGRWTSKEKLAPGKYTLVINGIAADERIVVREAEVKGTTVEQKGKNTFSITVNPIPASFTLSNVYAGFEIIKVADATITYNLNGGTLDGQTGSISKKYKVGEVITLPAAPTKAGYVFDYWQGSKYQPGDKYTVQGDHTFTAMYKPAPGSSPSETPAEYTGFYNNKASDDITKSELKKASALPKTSDKFPVAQAVVLGLASALIAASFVATRKINA